MADCPNAPGKPCDGPGWSIKSWTPQNWLMLIGGIAAIFGIGRVNYKVNAVEETQAIHAKATDQVKEDLDARSVVVDKAIGTLQKTTEKTQAVAEKTQATVADTLGPNLLASAKYLQQLSDDDPKDATAAARAKDAMKTYSDYIAKTKKP